MSDTNEDDGHLYASFICLRCGHETEFGEPMPDSYARVIGDLHQQNDCPRENWNGAFAVEEKR